MTTSSLQKSVLIIADTHIGSKSGITLKKYDRNCPTELKEDVIAFQLRTELRKQFYNKIYKHLKTINRKHFTHLFILGDLVDCNSRTTAKPDMLNYNTSQLTDHGYEFITSLPINKQTNISIVLGSFSHVKNYEGTDIETAISDRLISNGYNSYSDNIILNQINWNTNCNYLFYLQHKIGKKYFRNKDLWFGNDARIAYEENRKPSDISICGHYHEYEYLIDPFQNNRSLVISPPLSFNMDSFSRYFIKDIEKIGFMTVDFYKYNKQPVIKIHKINLNNKSFVREM